MPNSNLLLDQVLENYTALVGAYDETKMLPMEVITSADVVNTLKLLGDEQLACVFRVAEHSANGIDNFMTGLLGANLSPALVNFTNGRDQDQRVSLKLNGMMMIGVLYELGVCKLIKPVMGKTAASGLRDPYETSALYCLFTAAVGWALGSWSEQKTTGEKTTGDKRKREAEAISNIRSKLSNSRVLYAHDVCVHDNKSQLDEVVTVYSKCNLMTTPRSSTWLTPSPAAEVIMGYMGSLSSAAEAEAAEAEAAAVLSRQGVFVTQSSGNVAIHLGAAKALLELSDIINAPFDFVTTVVSDNSLGEHLVSKSSRYSTEVVEIPVGVLKPVMIVR